MAVNASNLPGSLKSIQRGVASGNLSITISPINPAKCQVAVFGGSGTNTNSASTTSFPRVNGLTSTALTIAGGVGGDNNSSNLSYSWELAEYY